MSDQQTDNRSWLFQDPLHLNGEVTGARLMLLRFSEAVDGRLPVEVARLFAVDGVFSPGDKQIRGRDGIEAFYTSRLSDPRRSTRHLWSNVEYRVTGDLEARLKAVLTVYAFEPQVSETHLQLRVGNVQCRCSLDQEGRWVFAEHLYVRAFQAHLPLSLPIESAKEQSHP